MNIGKNIVVILLLPFDYYRCNDGAPITGYGFFVYKDTVLLGDYAPPCYDPEKNRWLVEIEDEYVDIKEDIDAAIEKCNTLLDNTICKRAVVFVDLDVLEEHLDTPYEHIDFLPVDNCLDTETIKRFIEQFPK